MSFGFTDTGGWILVVVAFDAETHAPHLSVAFDAVWNMIRTAGIGSV